MSSPVSYVSEHANKVLIVANPKAGARSGVPQVNSLAELLNERGYQSEICTDSDQVAAKSTVAMRNGNLRTIVAAGGDGTVGMVANHTDPGVPITILPLGTENLLAKYLGIKADVEAVCQMIARAATVPMDAGRVDGRLFLLMVSCGFDADVVKRLHSERQGNIHHLSYAKPILDSIRNYEYPELRLECDDGTVISARWAFVFNLPCYALGLRIAPEASGSDGLLDVCTFKEGSLWNGLMYLGGVVLGQHQSWHDCVAERTRRIRIEADGRVPYAVDGDPGGYLPAEVEIVPKRLTLLVPEVWALKQLEQTEQTV